MKDIKFIPYEEIFLKTKLKKNEIILKISSVIEPERAFFFKFFNSDYSKPFTGEINDLSFYISRKNFFLNGFMPIINGKIEQDNSKSTIRLEFHLDYIVIMIFMASFIILGSVSLVFVFKGEFSPIPFYILGMLLFEYIFVVIIFNIEIKKTKKTLVELFKGEIINNDKK